MRVILAVLALLFAPSLAATQDRTVEPAEAHTPRRVPIAGYKLVLSWTPEYCHAGHALSPECKLPSARGFTLHGLWPDGADPKAWPQYCRATTPLTPAQLRVGTAVTPSPRLLQHEWDKHGSCMTADPIAYFAEERRLARTVRFPDMAALAARRDLTARQVRQSFVAANPGMSADMVAPNLNRRGWLTEIWLCLDIDKRPTRCPAGTGALPGARVRVQAPG